MRLLTLTALAALMVGPARAQGTANPGTGTVGTTGGMGMGASTPRPADAPVPGANSFTEGQARARIEGGGYAAVTDLRKDDQGIWRAMATRDGKPMAVALDFQGNVTGQ